MTLFLVLLGASCCGGREQDSGLCDDARSGKTSAYAEPWASAWGHHGGLRDDRWCSPPQWMYWRLLNDLHCGVSYIAIYGSDLHHQRCKPSVSAHG
jgi:hypothetical protein